MLATSLDYDVTLKKVTELAVSEFADWCVVYLMDAAREVHVVASAMSSPSKAPLGQQILDRFPLPSHEQHGVAKVVHTETPYLVPCISEGELEKLAEPGEHLELLRQIELCSLIVVPLKARGRTFGAITFATTHDSGRLYGSTDLSFAEELGRRAALAIDNARLYTDRLAAEEALRSITQELRALILASPLPIVQMDIEGRVMEWNPAAERVTGWIREEVIGKLNPMFPQVPDGRRSQLLALLKQGETIEGVVVRRKRREGSLIDLAKWASPIKDAQGKVQGFIAIYTDVTDRVRFLQVASHELGNPLSSIKALSSLLRFYVQRGAPKETLITHLDRLSNETDRFTSLFDEIITAFRTHKGTLSVEPRLIDARELVKTYIGHRDDRAHRFRVNAGPPAWIMGDFRRLQQVLSNLVDNACKYSPPKSTIWIALRADDEDVVISVRDEGVGIPKSHMTRIFDEFYQVDESQRRGQIMDATSGIGLGLFICREIILQHKGHIWAESEVGRGSTFFVRLPKTKDFQDL